VSWAGGGPHGHPWRERHGPIAIVTRPYPGAQPCNAGRLAESD
jgi:hypothetical protein